MREPGVGGAGTDWHRFDTEAMWRLLERQDVAGRWRQVVGWQRAYELAATHLTGLRRHRDRLVAVWPPDRSGAAALFVNRMDQLIANVRSTYEVAVANHTALRVAVTTLSNSRYELRRLYEEYVDLRRQRAVQEQLGVAGQRPMRARQIDPPQVTDADLARIDDRARAVMRQLSDTLVQARVQIRQPPAYVISGTGTGVPGADVPAPGASVVGSGGARGGTAPVGAAGASSRPDIGTGAGIGLASGHAGTASAALGTAHVATIDSITSGGTAGIGPAGTDVSRSVVSLAGGAGLAAAAIGGAAIGARANAGASSTAPAGASRPAGTPPAADRVPGGPATTGYGSVAGHGVSGRPGQPAATTHHRPPQVALSGGVITAGGGPSPAPVQGVPPASAAVGPARGTTPASRLNPVGGVIVPATARPVTDRPGREEVDIEFDESRRTHRSDPAVLRPAAAPRHDPGPAIEARR
ncbi:hypothetical protein O7632_27780 [Solwaraspora sp. WMMD406]|uniref:hypothetical protein n=1 Tax=Solwaraspora sp. WMMD406 TaxID=3016095 RepID=UPI0024172AA7|nr:hypothetical protein [Solwaraspora sp. WMMD406]MDG4767865.1 hypothetical protein [Solwaraspora sp. WMMD406]